MRIGQQPGDAHGSSATALADRVQGSGPLSKLTRRVLAYIALTKPRVIELLLVATIPTMLLADRGHVDIRLIVATLRGQYDGGFRLFLMSLAGLYIVSPIDAVPELFLTFVGLIDGAFVASWLTGTLLAETERFLEWEKTQGRGPSVVPGTAGRPALVGLSPLHFTAVGMSRLSEGG